MIKGNWHSRCRSGKGRACHSPVCPILGSDCHTSLDALQPCYSALFERRPHVYLPVSSSTGVRKAPSVGARVGTSRLFRTSSKAALEEHFAAQLPELDGGNPKPHSSISSGSWCCGRRPHAVRLLFLCF